MPSSSSSMTIGVIHRLTARRQQQFAQHRPEAQLPFVRLRRLVGSAFLCVCPSTRLFPECAQTGRLCRASDRMRLPDCPHNAGLYWLDPVHVTRIRPRCSRLGRARDHGILVTSAGPREPDSPARTSARRRPDRFRYCVDSVVVVPARSGWFTDIADQRPRVRIAILRVEGFDPREPHFAAIGGVFARKILARSAHCPTVIAESGESFSAWFMRCHGFLHLHACCCRKPHPYSA